MNNNPTTTKAPNCIHQSSKTYVDTVLSLGEDNPYYSTFTTQNKLQSVSNNDYLGLSKHPQIAKAATNAITNYGIGPTGSRVSIGTFDIHNTLESKIASFKGFEACTVLSSGFMANLCLLSNIDKDSIIFFDALSHACIIDGITLSGAKAVRFKHNDIDDLQKKLTHHAHHEKKLIITESLFSLDGDIAPLPDILALAKAYNCAIAIDEAHATGTLGATGRGALEHFNIPSSEIDFLVGTLSKAIGSEGGFICANQHIINSFNYSRNPYLFTSSRSFPATAASLEAFNIIANNNSLTQDLQQKATFFRQSLSELGFNLGESNSQIFPIMVYDESLAFNFHFKLKQKGIFAIPAIYPVVGKKQARIRINMSSRFSYDFIQQLTTALTEIGRELAII